MTPVHQDFTFSLDCSCLSDAAVLAGIFAKMMAFNSSSDRCLIHQIFKPLLLILNLVKNELGNLRERGDEGSVPVFRQPTSSSLKQSKQLTVGEWVRGISPIRVGFDPRVTNGAL